jgi:hypothetical protein
MRRILRNPYAHKHLHRLVLPGAPVRERLRHERSSGRRSARSCARDGHARTKQPRTGHRYNGLASLFKRRADSGSPFGTSLRGPGRHCPPGPRRLRGPVLRFDIARGGDCAGARLRAGVIRARGVVQRSGRKSCQRCGLSSPARRARAENCACVYRTRTRSNQQQVSSVVRATVS